MTNNPVSSVSITPLSAYNSNESRVIIIEGSKWAFISGQPNNVSNISATSYVFFPPPSGFPEFMPSSSIFKTAIGHKPGSDNLVLVAQQYNTSYPDTHNKVYAIEYDYTGGTLTPLNYLLISDDTNTNDVDITYDVSQGKFVILLSNYNGNHRSYVYQPDDYSTNLTDGNFIGFADANYSNGQTATIQIIGSVDDAQSGLTAGTRYFLQRDGSLDTTPDLPNLIAGTAIASNKIIVKK